MRPEAVSDAVITRLSRFAFNPSARVVVALDAGAPT